MRKRTLHKSTLFRVQKCRIGDQFRKGIVAHNCKRAAPHFGQRLLQSIVEQVLGKIARNSRMRCLIPQPLCRILLIKQVKNRVQLTFTHFKVVVPNIIDQLCQVTLLWQLISGGDHTKPCLGTRNRHIQ